MASSAHESAARGGVTLNTAGRSRRLPVLRAGLVAALLAATSCGPTGAASAPPAERLALHPCILASLRTVARCGGFAVRENRTLASGRELTLRVVVLPARGAQVDPVPIFLLTGGPGLGAAESPGYAAYALDGVRDRRDVVLVDQRGTGRSNPLECDLYGGGLQALFDPMFPIDAVRRCREQLAAHADLTQYATAPAIEDLDELRAALGAEQVDLFGVSYGTRVALEYLRRHGAHVRRMVVQGVIAPTSPILVDSRRAAERAMRRAIAECGKDAACHAAAPDPAADIAALLSPVQTFPARLRLWSSRRVSFEDVTLTPRASAERLWSGLYNAGEWRRLLPLVHQAVRGDPEPFVRRATAQSAGRRRGRSEGMMLSVICAEDAPRIAAASARDTSPALLGSPVIDEIVAACAGWPTVPPPADYATPVRSDVPVLLISGAFDPVTPPELAAEVAQGLSRATHLVNPAGGHADFDACLRETVAAFYLAPNDEPVRPLSCLPRWVPGGQ
jgi:pimeloyl-ACP methyl ester carboxylesterase